MVSVATSPQMSERPAPSGSATGPAGLWTRAFASPLLRRLGKAAFATGIGLLISRIMAFLAMIVAARLLSKEQFGQLGYVQTTATLIGVLAGMGLSVVVIRRIAETRDSNPQAAGRAVSACLTALWGTTLLGGGIMFFASGWLCPADATDHVEMIWTLRAGSLLVAANLLMTCQFGILAGFESFTPLAVSQSLSAILAPVCVAAGIGVGGLLGAVLGLAGAVLAGCILNVALIRRELRARALVVSSFESGRELRMIVTMGIPAAAAGLVVIGVNWLGIHLLTRQPDGLRQLGEFSTANQSFVALMFVPQVVGQAILPMLVQKIQFREYRDLKRLIFIHFLSAAAIVLPVVAAGWIFSSSLMTVFGSQYEDADATLRQCLLAAAILCIQAPTAQLVQAFGQFRAGFFMNSLWGLTFIGFLLAAGGQGAVGLAQARTVAYAAHAIWTTGFVLYCLSQIRCTGEAASNVTTPASV